MMHLLRKTRHVFGMHHNITIKNIPVRYFSWESTQRAKLESDKFKEMLPSIIDSLVKNPKLSQVPEVTDWVKPMLNYIFTGSNQLQGKMTVQAYMAIEKPENITEESLKSAQTLGWCVEIMIGYFLVLDDILDNSSIRRGRPCWYTLPGIGQGALKDVLIMHSSVYELIQYHFHDAPYYTKILELFNETILFTAMGEHLDFEVRNREKNDYSLFTIEAYQTIAKYKAAYFIFKLPIILGYLLANNDDQALHSKIEEVCLLLGQLVQIQNDINDCYGDETLTGKKGNDIEEGKCTWLSVTALRLCSAAQRAEFVHNYAHSDPARVQAVKQLYEQLNLPQLYHEEVTTLYNTIKEKTNSLPTNDKMLMLQLLDNSYT